MTSKEFTKAKRVEWGGPIRAKYCKLRRSREERRAARQRLHLGVDDLPPVLNPRHRTGAAAWWIS